MLKCRNEPYHINSAHVHPAETTGHKTLTIQSYYSLHPPTAPYPWKWSHMLCWSQSSFKRLTLSMCPATWVPAQEQGNHNWTWDFWQVYLHVGQGKINKNVWNLLRNVQWENCYVKLSIVREENRLWPNACHHPLDWKKSKHTWMKSYCKHSWKMANSIITSDKQEPKKRQVVYIEKLSEVYHGKNSVECHCVCFTFMYFWKGSFR